MLECVFAPILGVISLAACILLFAWLWDPRRKSALLRKFFEAKNSCQVTNRLTSAQIFNRSVWVLESHPRSRTPVAALQKNQYAAHLNAAWCIFLCSASQPW